MKTPALSMIAALLALAISACGGGTPNPNPNPSPNPNPNPNPNPSNAVRERLVACPIINQSSDPAASACLAGTYTGKTPGGADCNLIVEASGNYRYTSPALSYSYSATVRSIRVFGHQNVAGLHQVIWLISDPIQAQDSYELSFNYADGLGKKLEIEATKRPAAGGSLNSTCTATLT